MMHSTSKSSDYQLLDQSKYIFKTKSQKYGFYIGVQELQNFDA